MLKPLAVLAAPALLLGGLSAAPAAAAVQTGTTLDWAVPSADQYRGRYDPRYDDRYGRQSHADRHAQRRDEHQRRHEQQRYEQQRYEQQSRYDRNDSRYRGCDNGVGGAAVGAVAGGLLGNQVAGYGSKTGGSIVGAVLGGVLGNVIDRRDDPCRSDRNTRTRGTRVYRR